MQQYLRVSTLCVGLTGIVRTLIQKSMGMVPQFLFIFRLKQASGNMGAMMNN